MFGWIKDSLINLVSGMGTWKDATAQSQFNLRLLDRNQIENAYRADWVCRRIVDAPAEDATRAWRNWTASADQVTAIQHVEKSLFIQNKMKQALIRGRLYGGGALIIGVDQGESWEELDLDKVGEGDLKFVTVMNRYELMAGPRIYNVNSPWYTRPAYYTVSTPLFGFKEEQGTTFPGANAIPGPGEVKKQGQQLATESDIARQMTPSSGMVQIHPSRVVEFVGNELPDWRLQPMGGGWGDSVLQTVDEVVKDFGLTVGGIAAMINDAKIDVIKLPDFNERVTTDEYTQRLLRRFSMANQSKSTINSILLDKEEEWDRVKSNFAGLPNLLHEFMILVSAAGGCPPSRIFGQSIGKGSMGGSGKAGDSDLRNYYDDVSAKQDNDYSMRMTPLDQCIIRSALGRPDKTVLYEWAPLWELEPKEKAEIGLIKSQSTQIDVLTGLINEDVLRDARIGQLKEDDAYPGLEDAIEKWGEEPDNIISRLWSPGIDPHTGEPITPAAAPSFKIGPDGKPVKPEPVPVLLPGAPGAGGPGAVRPPAPGNNRNPTRTTDASPRSLYVRRDVINGKDILKWAREQGIPNLLAAEDLHVTLAYSREAVDWIKMGDDQWETDVGATFTVKAGGPRVVEKFGNALVLAFACSRLAYRHQNMISYGASWDHDDYNPHVSLTWDPDPSGGFDWTKVDPYRGKIVLGPEIFEEVKDGWSKEEET